MMFNTDKLCWQELIAGINGRLIRGDLTRIATGISTDTRTLHSGDLFVALKGPNFDGQHYISQAFEKGAVAALVSEPPTPGMVPADKVVIQVENTLTALGDLSSLWRQKFPVSLIGISGSNGKTTTKEMLAAILELEGPTLKNPGNLNNWIGLPLSLFSLNEDHRFAVMEMGMNHLGEIARLCQIAHPEVGLLTNIGPAHLEGLGSLSAIAQAKGELFEALEPHHWAVINIDDARIRELTRSCRARQITFGLDPEARVRADQLSLTPQGISFRILFEDLEEQLSLPIPGQHNVNNALGAAAAALSLGLSLEKVREGLNGFMLPEHRLQLKKGLKGIQLIDDTYNANPASLQAALSTFQSFRQGKRGGLVLGDMLELGSQALTAHQEIGKIIGGMGVEFLMTLGPLSREMVTEAQKGFRPPQMTFWAQNHQELVEQLHQIIREGDILLFKGSHGMNMEKIVRALEDQG
ncbi:MAG: UDP-N-acetylmuramoyl-tripeptide--D-alanyl-D-alanine ligase [Desulfobacca sp.]|nr:UDP-N-acetylmuramoyl-tripeptide--D-alanyl-D-alanine ligase [Desulfobacca sp.]